jgi:hypothetical protein
MKHTIARVATSTLLYHTPTETEFCLRHIPAKPCWVGLEALFVTKLLGKLLAFRRQLYQAAKAAQDESCYGSTKQNCASLDDSSDDDSDDDAEEKKIAASLGIGGISGTAPGMDEDELRENLLWRLDD